MRAKMAKKVFGAENDSDQSFSEMDRKARNVFNVGASRFPLIKKVGRRILNFHSQN